jgi:enamine deaminase RidA (YjgF/YER057c/UK114 family)
MISTKHAADNGAFLVISAPPGSNPADAAAEGYAQVGETLRKERLQIVQERVFGSLHLDNVVKSARGEALRAQGIRPDSPLNYLEGRPPWGEGFAGAIIHAAPARERSAKVQTLFDDQVPYGRTWQVGDVTFLMLQDIRGTGGPREDNSPTAQTQRAIHRADRLLRENGADYGHTVRTWFYLADILEWYDDFNRARSAVYRKLGLLPIPEDGRILPASTGIRAGLSGYAACSMDLLAVLAPDEGETVQALRNPLQKEAFRYGSAFSRGAAIHAGNETLVELSGTAAIDEQGASLYPGDIRAQVRCTLDKVAGVLSQAGAALTDLCAATLFVKNAEDADAVLDEFAAAGLSAVPALCVQADVCRDELLFEIDAEAVIPRA